VVPHVPPGEGLGETATSATHASNWRTTTQEAYGTGDGPEAIATQRQTLARHDAPWVRGRGGQRAECGRATSGCLGEVYKVGDNPQVRTASQRSWLYYKDPMLVVKVKEPSLVKWERCAPHSGLLR